MQINVQKFMELKENAIARERQANAGATSKNSTDWQSLLNSKRKEMGLEPVAPTAQKEIKTTKAVAADFEGTIKERVNTLLERSAEGLPVRELGNFIDVRA